MHVGSLISCGCAPPVFWLQNPCWRCLEHADLVRGKEWKDWWKHTLPLKASTSTRCMWYSPYFIVQSKSQHQGQNQVGIYSSRRQGVGEESKYLLNSKAFSKSVFSGWMRLYLYFYLYLSQRHIMIQHVLVKACWENYKCQERMILDNVC